MDDWTLAENRRLGELAGTMSVEDVARTLTMEFSILRTVPAVRCHARRLGVSLWRDGWSLSQLERLFAVNHRAILHWWVVPGLLVGERWAGRGPYEGWLFTDAALERFIRGHAYAYEWRRMTPGHRLTALAEVIAKHERWVGSDVVASYLGMHIGTLRRWMNDREMVPHKRRVRGGGSGEIMVRAADLPAIKEAIEMARQEVWLANVAKFRAMRRSASCKRVEKRAA